MYISVENCYNCGPTGEGREEGAGRQHGQVLQVGPSTRTLRINEHDLVLVKISQPRALFITTNRTWYW
jgi:hypothetical protein